MHRLPLTENKLHSSSARAYEYQCEKLAEDYEAEALFGRSKLNVNMAMSTTILPNFPKFVRYLSQINRGTVSSVGI